MNLITQIAREIRTKFLPVNYTPSEPNVQGHIEGIDIAIGTLDSNLDAKMDKDTIGTTGNLTVLDGSGNAVDAGYAASQDAVANSVVRRYSAGHIVNSINTSLTASIRASNSQGIALYAEAGTGSGVVAASSAGTYAIEALNGIEQVSGIRRVDGVLEFVGASVATNRAAQRTELGLGTAALAATGDFDAAGAAATAVSDHEIAYDHANIPSVDEAAALTAYQSTLATAGAGQILTASGPGAAAFAAAGYQKIVIMLTQLSVNAPTYVVLENTTGETIQSANYDGVGNYTITFTGTPIVDGKTTCVIAQNGGMGILFTAMVGGGSYLVLTSQRLLPTIAAVDGKMVDTAVEIRIYP